GTRLVNPGVADHPADGVVGGDVDRHPVTAVDARVPERTGELVRGMLPAGERELVPFEHAEADLVGMMGGHQAQLVDEQMPGFVTHAPIVAPSAPCGSTCRRPMTTRVRSGTRRTTSDC